MRYNSLKIFIFFVVLGIFYPAFPCLAHENITTEPYFRIRIAIKADTADAREVIHQLHNMLMQRGIVLTRSKTDPVIAGRVTIGSREQKKVNPYGAGAFTLNNVSLALKGLSIKDALGTVLASYQTFTGFGSHETASQAFANAAQQIVEQIKKTDFALQAVKAARRQDVIINISEPLNSQRIQQVIFQSLNRYMGPMGEELQMKKIELTSAIETVAAMKAKNLAASSHSVRIHGAMLEKIVNSHAGTPAVFTAKEALHELSEKAFSNKAPYKSITGVIIDVCNVRGFCRMRLQKIYDERGYLVFGGKRNPQLYPLLYFNSKDALLASDFYVEAKNPLMVRATGLTDSGHIVVTNSDADRMLIVNNCCKGKIFSEGRIFVVTGTREH